VNLPETRKALVEMLEDDSVKLADKYLKAIQESVLIIIEEENYRQKVRWLMGYKRRNI